MKSRAIIFDLDGVLLLRSAGKYTLNPSLGVTLARLSNEYDLFVNSSFPLAKIYSLLHEFAIEKYFLGVYGYEFGTKSEACIDIHDVYGYDFQNLIFIDDSLSNIQEVQKLGVNSLHYPDSGDILDLITSKK